MKLRYPTSNPGFHRDVYEEQTEVEAAIDALDAFLLRKKKPKKHGSTPN